MFIAGLGAKFEYDLKKIIVLSTLRQSGLTIMIISIGLSSLDFFFHLLTHTLLNGLLFVCAEGVIHCTGDSQDIRFVGGLSGCAPWRSG
jgi:NADH-ubiquinone oxidoreductase chain 5